MNRTGRRGLLARFVRSRKRPGAADCDRVKSVSHRALIAAKAHVTAATAHPPARQSKEAR